MYLREMGQQELDQKENSEQFLPDDRMYLTPSEVVQEKFGNLAKNLPVSALHNYRNVRRPHQTSFLKEPRT